MMMMAAMGLATVLGQVFLGKLALVSGAALMIAKISLLLALLVRFFHDLIYNFNYAYFLIYIFPYCRRH